MAKTLADIKKCPIDYLYLWASDEFISQLGSIGKKIKEKRYYQYQTLYKAVVENVSKDSDIEPTYLQLTKDIATAIEDTYSLTPAQILVKLAMGEEVAGKYFTGGVYGIGESKPTTFANGVSVDPATGNLMKGGAVIYNVNKTPVKDITWIYGKGGAVTGYSVIIEGTQYQVNFGDSMTDAYAASYSTANGVYAPDGSAFNAEKGTFWQNANNYMPMINKILEWVSSIVNSFFPNRTTLTTTNTVPVQTEWVEEESDNTGLIIAGGAVLAGVVLLSMNKPYFGKKKK